LDQYNTNWKFWGLMMVKLKIWESILVEIKRNDKLGDLIELGISLINEIRGLLEEIPKFWGWFGSKLQELKSKDQSENVGVQ